MLHITELQMFIISKPNHTFTGTAENVFEEQNMSALCVYCVILNSFLFKTGPMRNNLFCIIGILSHLQFP